MQRRLTALLACAFTAFGQRGGPTAPSPAAALNPLVVDAVAVDSSGRPVTDLTAGDFEFVHDGRARKITNFTWFDTIRHTAVGRLQDAEQLAALDLQPDEIRRLLVVIVDDLGLSPAGIGATRSALKAFAAGSMSSGGRMSILRSSGGSGVLQQLTGDARVITQAIDGIRYLGGGTSAAGAGGASWLALGHALNGLRGIAGRKAVVLFSENPGLTGPPGGGVKEVERAAHAAAVVVYVVHPLSAPAGTAGALESLARNTGGLCGADFGQVLQHEQGYYAIGFQPEGGMQDAAARSLPAVLKVRRPGVVVRSRAGYLRHPVRDEFPVPEDHAVLLNDALASPFSGAGIEARMTALFSEYPKEGPLVNVILQFDPGSFSLVRDLQGIHQGGAQLRIVAVAPDGRMTTAIPAATQMTLPPAGYRAAMENGLHISLQMKLPSPGAWQIRAVVADSASDRLGSATRFIEVPDVNKGGLAISGLELSETPPADGSAGDPKGHPGVRIFKPGSSCTLLYNVFNVLTAPDKTSTVEVQTRIFAGDSVVYEGVSGGVRFDDTPEGSQRRIRANMKLNSGMGPGDYIVRVTVRDLLAPAGAPRTATQFTDFQVRE